MSERTVLLLGCGPVGMATAGLLGKDRACERVITADIKPGRAAAAAELCGEKAVSVGVDCTDDEAMGKLMGDATLVVNTLRVSSGSLLPFIRGVVEAGVSYTDATTDANSLQSVFDSEYLHALAGHRSVSVVPGLGASPGLTNALTSYLGQRLERVDGARFYLVDDLSRRSPRQWRDRLSAFGSPALVWLNQGWGYASPLSEWEDVAFPQLGTAISCCTVGLEPVTLPYSFSSLKEVSCHRGFPDQAMGEVVRNMVRYGFAEDEPVETSSGSVSPLEFASTLLGGRRENLSGALSPVIYGQSPESASVYRQVKVSGVLRGKATEFTMSYHFPGEREEDNIAATLATGARMLLTRELPSPGLHAPESLDPAPFVWDMERRGVEIRLIKTVEE